MWVFFNCVSLWLPDFDTKPTNLIGYRQQFCGWEVVVDM